MTISCDVYKSPGKEDYYLYVQAEDGLSRVPAELLKQFGDLEKALSFELDEDRRLAREDPAIVMQNLKDKGYHLQLPPGDIRS